ncbi:hypothetical protein [Methylibium sp. T29]|uniref:hypothetical protein n=1 Tax=Methylibium sp. T29 TaxID=1430884 RepID=UPI0003F444AC|nr:hypothetical protein [Methylibium sp. T29]EWS53068.1 hypothetical protein X551_04139 [Methylibium sp. T29]
MMRFPAQVAPNVSAAYVEMDAQGEIRFGLKEGATQSALHPLSVWARTTAHDLEVSAVRQQLDILDEHDPVDVVIVRMRNTSTECVVVPIGARARGTPASRAGRKSQRSARSASLRGAASNPDVAARSAVVLPFRCPPAQGSSGTETADTVLVDLIFAGQWRVQVSIQANGALDARTKLRLAEALRDLSTRLLGHEALHRR